MKDIDVKSNSYAELNFDSNDKDDKFKVGDHLIISKCKSISANGCTRNWSEKAFVIIKIKNAVPRTHVISDVNGEEIIESFMKKNCRRLIEKSLEQKK